MGTDLYLDAFVYNLYTQYGDRKTLTVKFLAGEGSGYMADQTFVEGLPQHLKGNQFTKGKQYTKDNYRFDYWRVTGKNIIYTNRQVITIYEDIELTAIWAKESSSNHRTSDGAT